MKKKFAKMTSEGERLRIGLEKAEEVLSGAEALITKLSGEKGRWMEEVAGLRAELAAMPSLCLCSAGYMVYLARSDEKVRRELLSEWKAEYKVESSWEFMRFMRGESALLKYKSEGLPADDLSFDNSIIILDSVNTVLIIDPSQQAATWLKEHLSNDKGRATEFITYADGRFGNALELAVRFGKTLVVSEVDRVAPILYPMVRRDLMTEGPKKIVQVGEKRVDWKDSFKLFLLTRDPTLKLPPDARSLVTEVNFTITKSGLEGQLLGVTIQHEKPELEEQKSALLAQEDEYKMQLGALEETLLKELSESKGSLLENVTLINSLNEIKEKSGVIKESLKNAKELQVSLDEQREQYRPFARVGSEIFFLMNDLVLINHMYQFSLGAFVKVFNKTLDAEAQFPGSIDEKIKVLVEALQIRAFQYIAMSIFKEDRLMFGMHMVHDQCPDAMKEEEWNLFVGGKSFAADFVKEGGKNAPQWVPEEAFPPFQALKATLTQLFNSLNLSQDADGWYKWYKSEDPEKKLPGKLDATLTKFQRLVVLNAFRPDRLPVAIEEFIVHYLKLPSLNPSGVLLGDLVPMAGPLEPIILVITMGADPSHDLREYAIQVKGEDGYQEVGMGGGMQEPALKAVKSAASSGGWACLQNLHLVVDWVAQLEKELNMLDPDDNFRLWLTTEEHLSFPAVLLRQSLKMTFEAPPGLKKNLTRTYETWTPQFLEQCLPIQAQILFILAWFHGTMQERRTFIPQGWCKFYEFSASDLRAGADIIGAQCKAFEICDWDALHGLFRDAIYGGPIDNDFDTRILMTFAQRFFSHEMLGLKPGTKPSQGEQEPPTRRSTVLQKGISIPISQKHDDYTEIVAKLPESDAPTIFYLPPNADKAVQKVRVDRCLDNLKKLRLAAGGGGGRYDREIWQAKLKPFFQLWHTLTDGKETTLLEKPRETEQGLSPIASFVQLENQTGAGLVNLANRQLRYLEKVLDGEALLTTEAEKIGNAVLIDWVPTAWDKTWEGPESVTIYVRAMTARVEAMQKWREKAAKKILLDNPVQLKDVFRPVPLLNALRQETARKANVALDTLKLECAWGKDAKLDNCALSLPCEGCIMQACAIDSGKLVELQADSPNFNPVPPFRIGYTTQLKELEGVVNVPVYLNSSRETFVMQLPVPCTGGTAKWILTGVAIFFEE
eukprot:NODE_11_length_4205_cov_28.405919_g8_i0.p1 GENE.NODE_11_length_4205_cov_28.405919_g8_i0~~NODE_11_length_4205_cov_28.405919_g8_i0.p1  ORF type:complete len:1357 (-),score=575.01 NODE_11_length_4205_cov_28.405919_g8_i0:133-3657(-)